MKKVLVIGASGMVASRFVDLAKGQIDITSSDEKILDITNEEIVDEYFKKNTFDAVVNFAAFTDVDGAELQKGNEQDSAWKLNVEAAENIAKTCREKSMFLVHISTDFVFPGSESNPGPYGEDAVLPDNPEGFGWYGWTKNRAEKKVSEIGRQFAIVRYGYPFRAAPHDFKKDWARNLINLYNEQKLYPLFTDQVQSVLFIDYLVEPLTKIIDRELIGIFHIVSGDITTPFEIGSYLLEKYAGKPVKLQKGSMVEFLKVPGRTPRPRLGGLDTKITEGNLDIKFRTWREMVDEFVSQSKSSKS